ncbi:hypothetical protein LJC74_01495 [Eubacteriales bacterium OttesenSCG-928-A19]|nr:hypothetical protein [Eubacteriales bacterium OttesenSCG-928-A19]
MKDTIERVTPEVRASLPKVLIDYLWTLVGAGEARTIRLIPCALGMGEVQDVICETPDGQARHRVFGFPPVQASVAVRRHQNTVELAMA